MDFISVEKMPRDCKSFNLKEQSRKVWDRSEIFLFQINPQWQPLRDNDNVMVRSGRDNVGAAWTLSSFAALHKYTPPMYAKINRLASVYMGWRPTHGDGNLRLLPWAVTRRYSGI